MKFSFFTALTLAAFTAQSQAKWCCCRGPDAGSESCCSKIMGSNTFYAPGCGLINGQTCDLGGDSWKQEQYMECCRYADGDRGMCF
jgi:hypothetical protein